MLSAFVDGSNDSQVVADCLVTCDKLQVGLSDALELVQLLL
jgi:hypothetical protein